MIHQVIVIFVDKAVISTITKSISPHEHRTYAFLFVGHGGIGGAHGMSQNATLSTVRLKLRPFFVEHIPVVVRFSPHLIYIYN